jgi:hypothetical protein
MDKTLLLFILSLALQIGWVKSRPDFQSGPPIKPIAVIELFTSQGCSSCPAADKLLEKTINETKSEGKNIFALSYHVDYWDRLGWKDPFSASEFSQRQNAYAARLDLNTVYTPQIVVNGIFQFVGSNEHDLKEALNKSLNNEPKAAFKSLVATLQNNDPPMVKFSVAGEYSGCSINCALISLSETTSIRRGENEGITLTNKNVVRQFISIPAVENGVIRFKNSPVPVDNNLAIVAFLQYKGNLKIIGAARAELQVIK